MSPDGLQINHIVATDRQGGIGRQGDLPWHCSEDLKRFKKTTMGHMLLMGRKTYESIGRPLPGRYSIVVSSTITLTGESISSVPSLAAAWELATALSPKWGRKVYVIGGGQIYQETLDEADTIIRTRLDIESEGIDTWYPQIPGRFIIDESESFESGVVETWRAQKASSNCLGSDR